MSSSTTGLFAGLLLALIAATAGFGWLLLALLFAAIAPHAREHPRRTWQRPTRGISERTGAPRLSP